MPVPAFCRDCKWFFTTATLKSPYGECHLHPPTKDSARIEWPSPQSWNFPIVDGGNASPCSDAK